LLNANTENITISTVFKKEYRRSDKQKISIEKRI